VAKGVKEPPYTREILRLAASIPYLEPIEELEGAIEVRSKTCGSRIRMAVELDWADRIVRLRQAVEACAYGQASAALAGGHAMGRSADEVGEALAELEAWLAGEGDVPSSWPGLEALAPALPRTGRHGAILLPFQALLAAVEAAR
jgi:NifU-like protein involved in Fe-S cluster formation